MSKPYDDRDLFDEAIATLQNLVLGAELKEVFKQHLEMKIKVLEAMREEAF